MNQLRIFLFSAALFFSTTAFGQYQAPANNQGYGGQNNGELTHRVTYDISAKLGIFLPLGIVGVRNSLGNWGVRFGHSIARKMRLEYDADISDEQGVQFYSAYVSLRYDFVLLDVLPMHALFGGDFHYYKRINTLVTNTSFPFESVIGYHIGLGSEYNLVNGIYIRGDVRMGFRPGKQVSASLSLMWRFGGGGSSNGRNNGISNGGR